MPESHRRLIRNYLLDPKLQLKYTVVMVLLSSLLTGGLGYVWYRQMRETSMTVEVKALAAMDMDPAEVQQLKDEMQQGDNLRLLVLVTFGLLFAVVLAGYGIVLTHKIAGPLFKIGRYMNDVRDGKLGPVYDLRRGDQLQEFFEVFKQMHASLRRLETEDLAALSRVLESVERQAALLRREGGGLAELEGTLESLREIRDRKQARLGGAAAAPGNTGPTT